MKRGLAAAVAAVACVILAAPAAAFGIGGAAVGCEFAAGCVAEPVCAAMCDMQAGAANAVRAATLTEGRAVGDAEFAATIQSEVAGEAVPSGDAWGSAAGQGAGAGYADADGDGICDNRGSGYGSGSGYGCGNGYGYGHHGGGHHSGHCW